MNGQASARKECQAEGFGGTAANAAAMALSSKIFQQLEARVNAGARIVKLNAA